MRILLNAANLHKGGGVAVAASVIDSLSREVDAASVTVLCSTTVDANLLSLGTDTSTFARYIVHDLQGIKALWRRTPVRATDYDAVLNVFGPVYSLPLARGSTMGFAQGWIAFPDSAAYSVLSWRDRSRARCKYWVQAQFFRLAGVLVVEQEAIRRALSSNRTLGRMTVAVVPNAVDPIFTDPSRWAAVDFGQETRRPRVGVAAGHYVNKNLEVFPSVRRALRELHGIEADFFVTIGPDAWAAMSPEFRSEVTNLGPLTLAQSASFTASLDAVLFPTLLESFSATPIEARAVGTPLIASDLPVVRETVGDYAAYVDPMDIEAMAACLANELRDYPYSPRQIPPPRNSDDSHTAESRAMEMLRLAARVPSGMHPAEALPISLGSQAIRHSTGEHT